MSNEGNCRTAPSTLDVFENFFITKKLKEKEKIFITKKNSNSNNNKKTQKLKLLKI